MVRKKIPRMPYRKYEVQQLLNPSGRIRGVPGTWSCYLPPSSPTQRVWKVKRAQRAILSSAVKLRNARSRVVDMVIVCSEKDFILVTHLGRVDFLAGARSSVSVALGKIPGKQNASAQWVLCCWLWQNLVFCPRASDGTMTELSLCHVPGHMCPLKLLV